MICPPGDTSLSTEVLDTTVPVALYSIYEGDFHFFHFSISFRFSSPFSWVTFSGNPQYTDQGGGSDTYSRSGFPLFK